MTDLATSRPVRPAGWRERLAELFPVPERAALRSTAAVGGGLAVLAGTVVSLLRQPGPGALDTVWAEDGSIFLADAAGTPVTGALTTSYAGYFHTVPRLLAELVALAPAAAAAAGLAVAAALITAGLAGLVYTASAAHLRSRLARFVAAAVVVVPPLAQEDVPNSIANLHWPALYALFWVLLWAPARWSGRAVALATTALVVSSDILVLALLPLALVRVAVRRDGYSAALAAVFASGVALQLLGLLTGASTRDTDFDPVRAVVGYLLRTVPGTLVGARWLGDDHTAPRWLVLAALAWLLVLAAVVTAWRTRATRSPAWSLATVAGLHSVALYLLPVVLSGTATARYAVAPAMLGVTALVALLPPVADVGDGWRRYRTPGLALVVLLAVVCAVNLRVDNPRTDGPTWSDELAESEATCSTSGPTRVAVPITPAEPPWYAELPCSYLRP